MGQDRTRGGPGRAPDPAEPESLNEDDDDLEEADDGDELVEAPADDPDVAAVLETAHELEGGEIDDPGIEVAMGLDPESRIGVGVADDPTAAAGADARAADRAARSATRRTTIEATRRRSAELFVELRDEDASAAARSHARDSLVRLHLPLVEHCARRFRNRGEPYDDLVQVGTIGLIKSVDRFDTDRGVEFSTYATPTIIGEIKRYFRDKGWAIRVPRRLQELRMQIGSATAELTQSLGRSPTPRELSERIGCTVEDVLEGIESSNAYSTLSLDAGDDSEDGASSMLDAIGIEDEGLEHVEIRESIKPLIDLLEPREKKILLLRFFKNMTQSQIAEEIGVSQMHVSRLLNRTLEQLRTSLDQP